jgi:catechol 2,3-dioxygenase-like lactoylglutathione lyase family enzyme
MTILLDHLIVPSHDQVTAARFIASLLDVPWEEQQGHFSPVYVNATCTLDFGDWEHFEGHHYCFQVSDEEFDQIFRRLQATGVPYGSSPWQLDDLQVAPTLGGKNVYWQDADGHTWELLTVSYARLPADAASTAGAVAE